MSARAPVRMPGTLPGMVGRNLRNIRATTQTLADAAGLRLSVCPQPVRHECDPHLGTVSRDAYVGEVLKIPVRLQNRSGRTRVLALSAGPFRTGNGQVATAPTLSPAALDLSETESGLVLIGVDVTTAFATGYEYTTALVVSSRCCDPQELRVRLRVRPDGRAPSYGVCCAGAHDSGPCGGHPGRTRR